MKIMTVAVCGDGVGVAFNKIGVYLRLFEIYFKNIHVLVVSSIFMVMLDVIEVSNNKTVSLGRIKDPCLNYFRLQYF